MSYVSLRQKSRYLKEITKGASKELRNDEVTACESYADVYIEGMLGKSFDMFSDSYPELIVRVADMLASAMAWQYLHAGQSPKESTYASILKKQADEILKKIVNGEMGIKNPDGTWDEDYPGKKNAEDKVRSGLEIIV